MVFTAGGLAGPWEACFARGSCRPHWSCWPHWTAPPPPSPPPPPPPPWRFEAHRLTQRRQSRKSAFKLEELQHFISSSYWSLLQKYLGTVPQNPQKCKYYQFIPFMGPFLNITIYFLDWRLSFGWLHLAFSQIFFNLQKCLIHIMGGSHSHLKVKINLSV